MRSSTSVPVCSRPAMPMTPPQPAWAPAGGSREPPPGRLQGSGRLSARSSGRVGGVRAGSDGFIYEVDQAGQRLCAYWRGEGLARTRGAHEPGLQFVEHRLAISEVSVRLVEAARGGSFELVDWQSEPAAWRPF